MSSVDDSPLADFGARARLDGRGLLVVGAGQGIGRQTAAALTQAGARVVCCDIRADLAREVAEEVGGTPWVGDVTSRDDVARLVDEAAAVLGRIDGFVDIVGMAHYGDAVAIDDERLAWQFDIVLRHAVLLTQHVGPAMAATGGGTMVFVASTSGLTASPQTAAYGAAKAALISWVRTVADELGPLGIRANAVAPGMVWTPRVSGLIGEQGRAIVDRITPLRRMAVPADIASVALFLSTDLSAFVTGQTVVVDGGIGNAFPYPMTQLAELAGIAGDPS
jgi:NAD(P)-dependent dehydrogenase (short-subunit alcohol dehydrogenase family)